jgi:adenylate cyclase
VLHASVVMDCGSTEAAPTPTPHHIQQDLLVSWSRPQGAVNRSSIAVMPFVNIGAEKENDYFGDGLAEEVINMLAQVPGFRVSGRTSSFFFRGKDVSLLEIGSRLNVEHILEGSVRRAGNRIRVTAQLLKVADGFHLWSERYERELVHIFDIQDEITAAIASALRVRLAPDVAGRRHEPNLHAYEAYLKAREHFFKMSPHSEKRLKELLDDAIQLDPEFALAHSLLGLHYTAQAYKGTLPVREIIPVVRTLEEEALRIDACLPEAHAILGVCAGMDFQWRAAQSEWRLAMASQPGSRDVAFWYANHYLVPIGRANEAVDVESRVLDEDPLNLLYRHHFAVALRQCGRLAAAEAELRKVLEIEENASYALGTLGAVCAQQGRYKEALSLTEKAYALNPQANPIAGQLAALLVHSGATSRAEELIEKLRSETTSAAAAGIAVYHALCGDVDTAVKCAERAIEARYPPFVGTLGPLLRSSEEWLRLTKLMNLPE